MEHSQSATAFDSSLVYTCPPSPCCTAPSLPSSSCVPATRRLSAEIPSSFLVGQQCHGVCANEKYHDRLAPTVWIPSFRPSSPARLSPGKNPRPVRLPPPQRNSGFQGKLRLASEIARFACARPWRRRRSFTSAPPTTAPVRRAFAPILISPVLIWSHLLSLPGFLIPIVRGVAWACMCLQVRVPS
jgi:hypothetical protein